MIGVRLVSCKYTTGGFSPESGYEGLDLGLALVQPKRPGLVVAMGMGMSLKLRQQQAEGN